MNLVKIVDGLVRLDILLAGGTSDALNQTDKKLLLLLLHREVEGVADMSFSDKELQSLMHPEIVFGYVVPNFVLRISELLGTSYFEKAWSANSSTCQWPFDWYLADFILYAQRELLGGFEISSDVCNWLNELTEWEGVLLPRIVFSTQMFVDRNWGDGCSQSIARLGWFSLYSAPGISGYKFSKWIIDFLAEVKGGNCGESLSWIPRLFYSLVATCSDEIKSRYGSCDMSWAVLGYLWVWKVPLMDSKFVTAICKDAPFSPFEGFDDAEDTGYCRIIHAIASSQEFLRGHQLNDNTHQRLAWVGWLVLNHPEFAENLMSDTCWFGQWAPKLRITSNFKVSNIERAIVTSINVNGNDPNTDGDVDQFIFREQFWRKVYPNLSNAFRNLLLQEGGVNLVGWPRTEIGIGEDVRVAADALESVRIPFCIIDAATYVPPAPKQVDLGYEKDIVAYPTFQTDIVFLDASTQWRYYSGRFLHRESNNSKVVAVCPWELPIWPEEASFVLEEVDYFWAATKFIANAFLPYFESDRLRVMNPAVWVPEAHQATSLPGIDQPFRFLTIFDGLSSIHRKNPYAVVSAFQQAFRNRLSNDVELIVKTMNFTKSAPELNAFKKQIDSDRRIRVINATLSRDALWELVRSSHVLVSLHRSEGFGRNIAESMLIGRPVIVSRYSGNMDFCSEDNAYLVDGSLVSVKKGQYAFYQNQKWFDADVDSAAIAMDKVFSDYADACHRAQIAKKNMLLNFSVEATGRRYKDELERMGVL